MADDQGSPGSPPERPAAGGGRGGGGGRDDRPPAAAGGGPAGGGPAGGGPAGEPGTLLADLARLRRQTRAARHAYWFPLVLFGLLTCGAAPLYVAAAAPPASGAHAFDSGPILLGGTPFGTSTFYIGWYWAVALVGGYLLTLLWYRRHADRAGVRTPARGYLITGVVLTAAVLVIPPLTRLVPGLCAGLAAVRGRVDQGHARVPDHRGGPVGAGPGRAQPRPGGQSRSSTPARPCWPACTTWRTSSSGWAGPPGAPSPGS